MHLSNVGSIGSSVTLLLALALACRPSGSPAASADASASSPQAAAASGTATFDHSAFDALLKKHVKEDRVDYAALKGDRKALDGYVDRLAKLSKDDYQKLSRDEQMAFWIDAYNAITLRSIVDAYPIDGSFFSRFPKNSIRQIDKVWDKKHAVAGRDVSLNEIENEILRKEWKDPRVHASINCASKGCPPLRAEAFTGARLGEQLDGQVKRWVADPKRNQVDPKTKKVAVSKIFDWFGEDFGVKQDPRGVLKFLTTYGPSDWKPFLDGFDPKSVEFLDYDWSLNDV
jgi:hypothetical protein